MAGKFSLEFFEVTLDSGGTTFPSRLVMKSLVAWGGGEGDRRRCEEGDSLCELMILVFKWCFNTILNC